MIFNNIFAKLVAKVPKPVQTSILWLFSDNYYQRSPFIEGYVTLHSLNKSISTHKTGTCLVWQFERFGAQKFPRFTESKASLSFSYIGMPNAVQMKCIRLLSTTVSSGVFYNINCEKFTKKTLCSVRNTLPWAEMPPPTS